MIERLLEGNKRFREGEFTRRRDFFDSLVGGQHPDILFITCSDSRVSPYLITGAEPGELFMLRNPGNIVTPHEEGGAAASAIELAVLGIGVENIVVLGHESCAAVAGRKDPSKLAELPVTGRWVEYAGATVEDNVRLQLKRLADYPCVKEKKPGLHGWVFGLSDGSIKVL